MRMEKANSPAEGPALAIGVHSAHLIHKYIWLGLAIGLAILVAAFLYFCIKTKLYAICKQPSKPKGKFAAEENTLRQFQLEELVKATNNFSLDCLVGTGGFGNVYKGAFDSGGTLAIKKAHADSFSSTQDFKNEVRLLSKVKHRNLVGLVGFCEEPGLKGEKILVYEYVPNGSLLDYIIGRGGKSLSWRERVKVAIGAAKGIAHLHDGIIPSIIHRDIKPSNILVGDGFEAKVSDFGLVKMGPMGDRSHVTSLIKGTPGYLDPAYCSSFHLSPFSDVYGFGVILLQLIAGRPAVDKTRSQCFTHIIEWARPSLERGKVEEILDVNLLSEPCNMEMMLKMGQLGLQCTAKVPKDRPTMTRVWQELEATFYSAKSPIHNQPRSSTDQGSRRVMDRDHSPSFAIIDGVRFQRFHVDESISFQSLKCSEARNGVGIDIDKKSNEDKDITIDNFV